MKGNKMSTITALDAAMAGEIIIDDKTYEVIFEMDLEDRVSETLDECYSMYKIGNLTYSPSEILKNVDNIAWRTMLADEADSYVDEDILVYGYTLECVMDTAKSVKMVEEVDE